MEKRRAAMVPKFEQPPQAFLFYFTVDNSYSVITIQHRSWPPNKSLAEKMSLRVKERVHLRIEGCLVEAVLLAKGDQRDMVAKEKLLNDKLEAGPLDLDESLEVLENYENVEQVVPGTSFTEAEREPERETRIEVSESKIDGLTNAIVSLTKAVNSLNNTLKRKRIEEPPHRSEAAEESQPVLFEGDDLTKISGKRSSKFALNAAKRLFSSEELEAGMISPQKVSKARKPLSPTRTQLLKDAVRSKFGAGQWEEARAAVNQYGLDAKRRKL